MATGTILIASIVLINAIINYLTRRFTLQ
jgi:hypothetical protein